MIMMMMMMMIMIIIKSFISIPWGVAFLCYLRAIYSVDLQTYILTYIHALLASSVIISGIILHVITIIVIIVLLPPI